LGIKDTVPEVEIVLAHNKFLLGRGGSFLLIPLLIVKDFVERQLSGSSGV
jgi:hypothetical protein